ncbi:T9SS type A sorting domain-containing protein [Portibacter marinus]|uniref:T9SS type A sorting domain-containing protein n=1 Tax=Portibacter marinus TaxID=2898660 RepID=UPI001F1A07B6|nr:T9SS type A sorting domain-containing protein [Portibacter marinus]
MKVLTLVASFLLSFAVAAQIEWAPIGSDFYYTNISPWSANRFYARMHVEKDTVINGINARKMVTYDIDEIGGSEELYDVSYIHQDEYKIYRFIDGKFRILYDFNLELHDTLKVYVSPLRKPEDSLAYMIVDSTITTFAINGYNLRAHKLYPLDISANESALQFGGWALEFFGSLGYFFPLDQLEDCERYCPTFFRCFVSEEYTYHRYSNISCDTILLVASNKNIRNYEEIKIAPNPGRSNGISSIEMNLSQQHKSFELGIFSLNGRLIYKQSGVTGQELIFKNPEEPGVYLIKYSIGDVIYTGKLMVI